MFLLLKYEIMTTVYFHCEKLNRLKPKRQLRLSELYISSKISLPPACTSSGDSFATVAFTAGLRHWGLRSPQLMW